MDENLIIIKEVTLNNNCPKCYDKSGLLLTFKQKLIENKFYKSITPQIVETINCKTCNTVIYPEQWTDDIDRIVEYQKKAFKPMATSTYIKKTSWLIMVFISIIILAIILLVALT